MTLTIHDPVEAPRPSRLLARLGERALLDPRDTPFLGLILELHLVVLPLALAMFVVPFHWAYGVAYLAVLLLGFLDRFILMSHNLAHRATFRKPWRGVQTSLDWVIGPLFGHTPHSYFVHHLGMHHVEENGRDDRSSTERFTRDSAVDFARYVGRFLTLGIVDLVRYLGERRRTKLLGRLVRGELAYWGVTLGLLAVAPGPTLFVLVLPLVITRFLMMAGNWGQHAFIDPARPQSPYASSITCINSRYNRRAFNDGYHIGHHLAPRLHWTELPRELLANREVYARERAIVFEGVDFFLVWGALMLRRYQWLAARVVSLDGEPLDRAAVAELLRARTRPLPERAAPERERPERALPEGAATAGP